MQPIMAVWAGTEGSGSQLFCDSLLNVGYDLGTTSIAESQLGPYIQQAIDQVFF